MGRRGRRGGAQDQTLFLFASLQRRRLRGWRRINDGDSVWCVVW